MRTELFFRPPESVRDVEVQWIKPRRCGSAHEQLVVFQSRKNKTCLRMSPNLLDFCLMLERRPDIRFYQPTPYTLIQPSHRFNYTPAVCAYGDDLGLVFFETNRFLSDGDEDELARHADWFGEMGYQFISYPPCPRISYGELLQWRYLYSYSFHFKTEGNSDALDCLTVHKVRTVQELLDAGASFGDIAFQLFYAKVTADLRFPITRGTPIVLAGVSHE